MSPTVTKITTSMASAFALVAMLAPSAGATSYQDLRSPDARDAAAVVEAQKAWHPTDLRSPDARDAATAATSSGQYAQAISALSRERVAASSASGQSSGLDWGDAGIGAGGFALLVLIGAGGVLAVSRHRGGERRTESVVSS
jgi:hypothetical protein